jgi:hypothetical protein
MGTPTIPKLVQHVVASVCDVRRARGEMAGVDKTGDMRRRARRGEPIAAIARAVGVSEPTARKYARMDDLSPEPPRRKEPESEVLAPYEGTTGSWLDDDRGNWRKQRHTAVRACVRLRDELGYEGSYSTARRYVRCRREEMARERDRRDAEGFLPSAGPGGISLQLASSRIASSRLRSSSPSLVTTSRIQRSDIARPPLRRRLRARTNASGRARHY